MKFALQELQYHIVWANYGLNSQMDAIDFHCRYILVEWMACDQ